MIDRLAIVTVIVDDQDEAHAFYTDQLGFVTRSDGTFGPGTRWLTVATTAESPIEILLQAPDPDLHGEERADEMRSLVGKNPTWSFHTDDCRGTVEELEARGVDVVQAPAERPYGLEAVFEDLYGNRFSLLEPAT